MLQDQTISISFGQGLDTKSDPKMVMAGKFPLLENALFTSPLEASKRNGYTSMSRTIVGGGTLSAPKLIKEFDDELLCVDSGRLYSYSTQLDAWLDKGKYQSVAVSDVNIASDINIEWSSSALLGNYQLFFTAPSLLITSVGRCLHVLDITTNTFVISNLPVSSGLSNPKCITLGNSALALIYSDDTNVFSRVITVSGSGVTVGSPVVIGTNPVSNGTASALGYQMDAVGTASGGIVVYSKNTGLGNPPTSIEIVKIDTAGAVVSTVNVTGTAYAEPLQVNVDPTNNNIWVYWVDNTTPATCSMYYMIYSSSLTQVLAKTLIAGSLPYVSQISAYKVTTTSQKFYYTTQSIYWNAVTHPEVPDTLLYQGTCTAAGSVTSPTLFLTNVDIYTKPFTVGSFNYMGVHFRSFQQGTQFIIDLADGKAVAKYLPGRSNGVYQPIGYLASVCAHSSTQVSICANSLTSAVEIADGVLTNRFAGFARNGTYGVTSVILDFDNSEANQALLTGNTVTLNGGIVQNYDGASISELGFNHYPDYVTATQTTGGFLPDGTYTYYVIYSWIDIKGNLHQSAPVSTTITIASGGGTAAVSLVIPTISLTAKPSLTSSDTIRIDTYRTNVNETVPRWVNSRKNSRTAATATVLDVSEASVDGQIALYTTGGVVDNIAPPPSMVMMLHQNRVWALDSENPNTNVWYTKTLGSQVGISFSDLFVLTLDARYGEIKGLSGMDEKTVFLKEKGNLYFAGNPGNDLGLGSTLSDIQVLPSDTGCSTSKSVLLIPAGIVCKTPKGIYILDRSLSFLYLGFEVEGYNSQQVTSVTMLQNRNHVRFLTDSGSTLVFDYAMKQWSAFTNHQGYSADIWNGTYVYVRTDGLIFKESTTSFLDNATAFAVKAKTAHLKLAAIQGFQRVRRFALLGDFQGAGGHGVQVSCAYDFTSSFSSPIAYSFTGASGPFQYRERLPIQKCNSVQLYLEEITTGASGEFIALNDLTFEAGLKKGINKLPAGQSNG